ncbi:cytochrome P450 6B4-like [Leguminivora glycinivorella]|uniref:cytochrome P450 6B4-like n=1 Tax=Leguminivora glycinivorella TaxID=1035111 RepID=UPI00200D50F0|nr:cytochrome P450 6B4-like [Leguminivora glycinivorella]
MPVILAATVIILVTLIYIHFTKHNDDWIEKNVPGPEPTFFFGNVEDAVLRRKHIGVIFKNIYEAYPDEKVLGIFVLRNQELLVRDLDVVKNVLIKDSDVFIERGVVIEKNLESALLHNDDTWKVLFRAEMCQKSMHLLTEKANRLVDYVDEITQSNQEQNVYSLVQKCTQASVASAFGVNLNTFDKECDLVAKQHESTLNFGRELELMYPGILNRLQTFFLPTKNGLFLFEFVKKSILQTEVRNNKDFMGLITTQNKEELISELNNKGTDITDEMKATQGCNFYALGNETTASTLSFLLYQLALNPDIQDKVVAETKEMLENHNGEITLQGILDLSYMGKVYDETLRMYPVVPDLKRKSTKAYKIPDYKLSIEKGQCIRISVLGIHHDEKIYPNPEVFDPERFSPENVAKRHECSYLPFGLGPGHCIAKSFAEVITKVCLLKLLTQFRVEPSKNTPPQVEYDPTKTVLCPKNSILINFVKRERSDSLNDL